LRSRAFWNSSAKAPQFSGASHASVATVSSTSWQPCTPHKCKSSYCGCDVAWLKATATVSFLSNSNTGSSSGCHGVLTQAGFRRTGWLEPRNGKRCYQPSMERVKLASLFHWGGLRRQRRSDLDRWCRCCAPRAARRSPRSAWWRRKMAAVVCPLRRRYREYCVEVFGNLTHGSYFQDGVLYAYNWALGTPDSETA